MLLEVHFLLDEGDPYSKVKVDKSILKFKAVKEFLPP